MPVFSARLAFAAFALQVAIIAPDDARASEWGCEVLLCSSSSVSWRTILACHSPMFRLLSEMKSTKFRWPTCEAAGTGAPGFEPYDECPQGYQIGSSRSERSGSRYGDICIRTINRCEGPGTRLFRRDNSEGCIQTLSVPRPRRENPYYFDITNDAIGRPQRHWFELNR